MSSQLATRKRLLTSVLKKLEQEIGCIKEEKLENTSLDPRTPWEERVHCLDRLEEAITIVETITGKVEKALFEYAEALDNREEVNDGERADFELYSTKAESGLSLAFDHLILLQARLQMLKSKATQRTDHNTPQSPATGATEVSTLPGGPIQPRTMDLPPIPVPTFTGDIWEWDNFWEIFNNNINSTNLPELVKYNYLLDALKGEARESIIKFRVTRENYPKAIECLLNKYNNKEKLMNHLIERLESCTLRSPSIKDQRSLLEQLQAITSQLSDKGEDTNSTWFIKKVLAKFPDSTKRKVINKRQGLATGVPFTMSHLIKFIDEILSTEEAFILFTDKSPERPKGRNFYGKTRPTQPAGARCMYCSGNHSAINCTVYTTPTDRSAYLRDNNLCLICASPNHISTQCKGRACFKCNGPHHTSCCFKAKQQSTSPFSTNKSSSNKTGTSTGTSKKRNDGSKMKFNKIPHDQIRSNARLTQEAEDSSQQEIPMLPIQRVLSTQSSHHPCLPTGEVTVLDPATGILIKVDVLFDTGAEVSFIDSSLAKKLRLPVLEERSIRLNTFGTKEVVERQCQKIRMEVWDQDGDPHSLELLTHNILTHSLASPSLSDQDQEFLRKLDLPIKSRQGKKTIQPSILLGCDLLWSFVRNDMPPFALPSGLHVLPTKLGYLLSGKPNIKEQEILQVSQHKDNELELWEQRWSMNSAQVYTISESDLEIEQQEKEQWEQYWTMDSAATEEFLGPEKEAQSELDKRIWEQFNESIERRKDGYYVHLPWKEQHPTLPDNRALAHKRLLNVWNSLKKDEQLLDQYNNVFQDQLNKGIVELVDENKAREGAQIHYIPHQPVLTPQKSTTKLRIVFDASAHYKGCPSLNDVLHRGPVILPPLYGLLLRFRIGRIALISDVEKAFLQVRLHEADRDATRCLWLKDHKKPPSIDNIRTLRFTRVTFGLKSSPFLLAGTTYYHLDNHHDEELVREIKGNLYVDNILLTCDTCEEAMNFYCKTKAIFNELKMNLREFTSNDSNLMSLIPEPDKSTEQSPKVLGIKWSPTSDTINVQCSMKEFAKINKRTITSALATIYDPLGWFIPLLHQAKVFLQNLWKEQYQWDTPLPKEKANEWAHINHNLKGFCKNIPRFVAPKKTETILIVFADASATGITACSYLHYAKKAHLLMAKSKLPSIHGKTTIPKLELNAITLAARLGNAIVTQLKSALNIRGVYILSDSIIALCWIKSPPTRELGIFVHNRQSEIRRIVNHLIEGGHFVRFGHVPSGENPADCGTRGLTKDEFYQHHWWTGPSWFQEDVTRWPIQNTVFEYATEGQTEEPADETGIVATTGLQSYDPELLEQGRIHTFTKAKRIIAYALRFVRSTVAKINKKRRSKISITIPDSPADLNTSSLCGSEVEFAGKVIVKAHQTLKVTTELVKTLKDLNIKRDDDGILRCYGRLGRAKLEYSTKYPIFILQKTLLANIIIEEVHYQGHTGINHTISLVRQQFWIPQLRSQVQRMIRRCLKCQRFNNLPYRYPPQDDLPKERVIRSRPFEHVGLDYFGPLSMKGENENQGKCYGAIITCMTTRLLHLDVVSDLSTVAFLHMLRRFFARRGVPRTITSDNAPTFLLGDEILRESLQAAQSDPSIAKELSNRGIDWRHITPYAPWQGGFYERLIKSIKHSLYKTLGKSILSFEELSTVLAEIEAILNTRPLTYESSDMDRDQLVRPIDFLQKEVCLTCPILPAANEYEDLDYIPHEEKLTIQTKRQAIAALQSSYNLTEKFWKVWQEQYLISLREKHTFSLRQKRGCTQQPKKGALVLVSETTVPRHAWKMGKIQELVTNARGVIREATIRLPSRRLIRRPINLLVPLELEDDSSSTQDDKGERNANSSMSEGSGAEVLQQTDQTQEGHKRYELRQRQRINYSEL